MPRVSVIIPTHSRPGLLPRAVESACRAGRDVEVVIVDDASTDETARVCRELEASHENLRVVRLERNQGVAGARNIGLMASSGEYIAFLDDDDLRLEGSLERQVEALEREPLAGMAVGGITEGDTDCVATEISYGAPQKSGDLFWEMLALNIPILPIAVVVRRECFLRIGLFNCEISGLDDWDLWTRVSELYPIVVDPEPVCIYRVPLPDSGQGSSDMARHLGRAARHQEQLMRLPRAAGGTAAQRAAARRTCRENLSLDLVNHAKTWARHGARGAALANVLMAIRLCPRRLWIVRARGLGRVWGMVFARGEGGMNDECRMMNDEFFGW